MATKYYDKIGYNSTCIEDMSEIVTCYRRFWVLGN